MRAELKLDLGCKGSGQQLFHVVHQQHHIDRGAGQRLSSGEGQQAVGEGAGFASGSSGQRQVTTQLVVPALRQALFDHVLRAGDHGQQVVEVMGQAAGELAERFHLLALLQLLADLLERLLPLAVLGDVPRHGEVTALEPGYAPVEQQGLAIAAHALGVELDDGLVVELT